MTYIVFARKWRPKTFDEIIGQNHIAQTLKNAIKNDRVAHAYIFAGPRGVGKTSVARIFAKALNCEKGPAPEPCNSCTPCGEIAESRSLDVLEIDGASNRGIDEIRNLRQNVKFAPTSGKFKIYIIDEVHMLTTEAFNALLKTLEEPPPHVKFIFATTRPNKVLATILSRCQRFDFRKIPIKDIIGKLSFISKEEDLKISEDALFAIARAADGSMRDAESILDQLSSFANKKIGISDVTQVLGTLGEEILFELADAIAKKETSKALKMIDDLVKDGKDISFVGLELLGYFRNLLIAKMGKDLKELIDLAEDSINKLSQQAKNFTIEDLLYALNVFSNTQDIIRKINFTRVPLEMAVIKLTKKDSIRSLGEILDKISSLEEKIRQGKEDEEAFTPKKTIRVEERIPEPEKKVEKIEKIVEAEARQEESKEMPEETKDLKKEPIPLKEIEQIWPNLIKRMRTKKISIASCLLEGELTSSQGDMLTLGFPKGFSFHKEILEEPHNRKLIEDTLSELLGRPLALKFIDIEERSKPNNIELESEFTPTSEPLDDGIDLPAEHRKDTIVNSALDIFKGRVINNKKHKE